MYIIYVHLILELKDFSVFYYKKYTHITIHSLRIYSFWILPARAPSFTYILYFIFKKSN